jgi:hypothetical protein
MKTYAEVEIQLHTFLTVDGGKWSSSLPGSFIPGERPSPTLWIDGSVGPTTGLNCLPLAGSEPTSSSRIPVTESYYFKHLNACACFVVAVTIRCLFRSHSGDGLPLLLQFWGPEGGLSESNPPAIRASLSPHPAPTPAVALA